jgi:Tfp pilus assembly protein PilO
MMKFNFTGQKNAILAVLALLIAADAAMTVYSVSMTSSTRSPQQELAVQTEQRKLLQADVARARSIQKDMPKTKADCDSFQDELPPAGTGYSVVSSELAEIAQKTGLQIESLSFHQKDLAGRGMSEISIDATINGDYKSVVRFLNGLQRSANNYVLENLTLASEPSGQGAAGSVKVALHLTSYFKAAV